MPVQGNHTGVQGRPHHDGCSWLMSTSRDCLLYGNVSFRSRRRDRRFTNGLLLLYYTFKPTYSETF